MKNLTLSAIVLGLAVYATVVSFYWLVIMSDGNRSFYSHVRFLFACAIACGSFSTWVALVIKSGIIMFHDWKVRMRQEMLADQIAARQEQP